MKGRLLRGRRGLYRVEDIIGRGGMGEVYRATSVYTGEAVAVKVPRGPPAAERRVRFEARLLRGLRHHFIVGYRDEGEYGGTPFLVEEFVLGRPLDGVVREEGPREDLARGVLAALLLALDYLHSKNIVHRDVKPRNIMVGGSPARAKLVDLGTAVYYNVAGLGDIVYGAGGYTAPEQYSGIALPQSDLWGAMATAFYMLTGYDPVALMPGYPHSPPPAPVDPRRLRPDVDPMLASAIARGLSWSVLDRFLTAREALDYLEGRLTAETGPVIEVFGVVIPIATPSLVFGRMPPEPGQETLTEEAAEAEIGTPKVRWWVEGDVTYVQASDPFRWISRYHFEIRATPTGYCIRDLGSTNRTAVLTRTGLAEVWQGRGVISRCVNLGDRAVILVAYGHSLQNPPYLTVVFRS